MNIQIFGSKKCFDTKKAERYFKERKIKFQSITLNEKGMSKGEYNSIKQAVGGMNALINRKSKAYEELFIEYLGLESDIEEKLLANPELFITPIVRDGKKATTGFCPEIWKDWI